MTTETKTIDRLSLLDWLEPNCEPDHVALLYPKGDKGPSPGWVKGRQEAARAIAAYRAGALASETFPAVTKAGVKYRIAGAERLGLVPHRNGRVLVFCLDLDDHAGTGGNLRILSPLKRFFGADPVVFTSRSGKGLHVFFRLAEPVTSEAFVQWAKAWGFNRQGNPELFPKTTKNTQAWLPNEPNDRGGDAYQGGSFAGCIVAALPHPPPVKLTSTTLDFLRGFVDRGFRNEALNKAAFELGAKRVDRAEAWRLCKLGAVICGLHAEEPDQTETTFASGYDAGCQQAPAEGAPALGAEPAAALPLRKLDGIGNGERFADRYRRAARYCYGLGKWLVWTGKYWSLDAEPLVESMAKQVTRGILGEMERSVMQARSAGAKDEDIEAIRSAYDKHHRFTACVRGMRDMLTMAQSEQGVPVRSDQIDTPQMLLNCRNGTIDLASGALRPHSRSDGITKILDLDFNLDAQCPRWEQFIRECFEGQGDLIEFIHRAVGYTLTGKVAEQCLFFLHGEGRNGKTVFVQTLLHLLGPYALKAPSELIMRKEHGSSAGASPELARLKGARMVVASEVEEGQRMGEAKVKDLTGSDRLVARPLYCAPIEFDPTHKLWIYGNHKPTVHGTDYGIWRRIRLIPFANVVPDEKVDPDLVCKLYAEREGILAWAVRGCLTWQRDGLHLPDAVQTATSEYRQESDRPGNFLEERCIVAGLLRADKSDLYAAYEEWCKASGERPLSKRLLGIKLKERGFADARDKNRRFWLGLGLLAVGAAAEEPPAPGMGDTR